jgi:cytochrome c2
MTLHRFTGLLFVIAMFLLAFSVGYAMVFTSPQVAIVPGSAEHGAQVFQDKRCASCHSLADLTSRSEETATPALLASTIWNHTPVMWKAAELNGPRPPMSPTETADLFAYFYSMNYFTSPGDSARGKAVFQSKRCVVCHTSSNGSRPKGPPLAEWKQVKDPIGWAERMWNHSGPMYAEMQRSGLSWPQMTTQNMVDLLLYIRNLPETRSQSATFKPGEPDVGRNVFEQRCDRCHTFGTKQANKIDLLERQGPRTLTDYVAAMWNHAPTMHQRAGAAFPVLAEGEMRNLIAYLFSQRYFFEKGDVGRGERVYHSKNCYLCHEDRREATGAPNLAQEPELFSPVTMASAVWLHGPAMMQALEKEGLNWPEFHNAELTDLIAYLNSRLNPKIGGPRF